MEKLIELLNEYEFKVADTYNYAEREATEDDLERLSERIISKKYGFIKWLVENDKINANKLEKIGYKKTVYDNYGQYREIVEYSDYEALLMILSIQDEPIEFLISILKQDDKELQTNVQGGRELE